jgi:heme a synthase
VAGRGAGSIYNTFPLMGGSIVPEDYWAKKDTWENFTTNDAAVQFNHRYLAMATTGVNE